MTLVDERTWWAWAHSVTANIVSMQSTIALRHAFTIRHHIITKKPFGHRKYNIYAVNDLFEAGIHIQSSHNNKKPFSHHKYNIYAVNDLLEAGIHIQCYNQSAKCSCRPMVMKPGTSMNWGVNKNHSVITNIISMHSHNNKKPFSHHKYNIHAVNDLFEASIHI